MTMRYTLGLGLTVLLVVIFAASIYWLVNRKRFLQRSKRRLRPRGRKVRIDDLMVRPDSADSAEP
jgi:hypothetical protein